MIGIPKPIPRLLAFILASICSGVSRITPHRPMHLACFFSSRSAPLPNPLRNPGMIGQSQKDPLPQKRIPGQVPDHPSAISRRPFWKWTTADLVCSPNTLSTATR